MHGIDLRSAKFRMEDFEIVQPRPCKNRGMWSPEDPFRPIHPFGAPMIGNPVPPPMPFPGPPPPFDARFQSPHPGMINMQMSHPKNNPQK